MNLIDKVKIIDIDKIYPYTNNPKEHPEKQINKIASSIKNFGFTVPIIIDNQNEIISGHGRYKAAQKLELDKIPCIVRDDLNAAQIKAFRITDNKIAKSNWDQELLMIELGELEEADINIELTGFDEEEIENLSNVQEMSIEEIEDLLTDLSLEKTVEKPDWFVIRAPSKNRSEIEQALNKIKKKKIIKVEKSYEKK
jgi:ParB/RepB/Spo0J family partition protein